MAVKLLESTSERIHAEADLLNKLKHKNIVKLLAVFHGKQNGLALELMQGGSLHELLHQRPNVEYFQWHILGWAQQAAAALSYIHRNGYLHRDIKPSNMLLTHDFITLKLCDFGTVAELHTSMTNNRGTPACMAPEVYRGTKYNQKCDIFSFAMVFWEVAARRQPLSVLGIDNPHVYLYQITQNGLRPPRIPGCDAHIMELIERCWQNDAQERPAAEEVVSILGGLLCEKYPNEKDKPLVDKTTKQQAFAHPAEEPSSTSYDSGPHCSPSAQPIMERMTNVCLREIDNATFRAPEYSPYSPNGSSYVIIEAPQIPEISNAHENTVHLFAEFVQALRSSRVMNLTFMRLDFVPELATLILETPVTADKLVLRQGSCALLTPTQFHQVVKHFSPIELEVHLEGNLRAGQFTDELLRELYENRARRIVFDHWNVGPVGGGRFHVTDDAVVELCLHQHVQIGQGEDGLKEPVFHNGSFTKGLVKRVVEASSVSMRTQPLRIILSPSPVEEKGLRDYAEHVERTRCWYYQRGQPWQQCIYDFLDPAMRLQIVLNSGENMLIITRAHRSFPFFKEADQ